MKKIISGINFLRSYTMRVPLWLRLVMIGLAAVIPAYWAITGTGLHQWVTDWQIGWMGDSYYPALSFFVSFLFCLMPVLAISMILGAFFPEKHPDETNIKKGI